MEKIIPWFKAESLLLTLNTQRLQGLLVGQTYQAVPDKLPLFQDSIFIRQAGKNSFAKFFKNRSSFFEVNKWIWPFFESQILLNLSKIQAELFSDQNRTGNMQTQKKMLSIRPLQFNNLNIEFVESISIQFLRILETRWKPE